MVQKVIESPQLVHALGIIQLPIQELAEHLTSELGNNPMFEDERDVLSEGRTNLTEESLITDSLPGLPAEDETDFTSLHLEDDQYVTLDFVEPELEELFDLDGRPADPLPEPAADAFDPTLLPDLIVTETEEYLTCDVNIDPLPNTRLNPRYARLLADPTTPAETTEFLNDQLRRGKWLLLCVEQRNHLLKRLGDLLIEEMPNYLTGNTTHLLPIPISKAAKLFRVQEATLISVIANKSLSCPAGNLFLPKLFTHGYIEHGLPPIFVLIREIVETEHSTKPMSDEQISSALAERGVQCARRTVAKYRHQHGVPNSRNRRQR